MKTLNAVTQILLIVGGLNWGLVGLFNFDLVAALFGNMSTLSRIVYTLVGISAVYQIFNFKAVVGESKVENYSSRKVHA